MITPSLAQAGVVGDCPVQYTSGGASRTLNCTAADDGAGVEPFGEPLFCLSGETFEVDLFLSYAAGAAAGRNDIRAWTALDDKDPGIMPANGGSNSCSATALPIGPIPWVTDEEAGVDDCGDVDGTVGVQEAVYVDTIEVECRPGTGGQVQFNSIITWETKSDADCDLADPRNPIPKLSKAQCSAVTSPLDTEFLGRVTVFKSVPPDQTDVTDFEFVWDNGGQAPIDDGGDIVDPPLPFFLNAAANNPLLIGEEIFARISADTPAIVTITEVIDPGYALTGISCSGGASAIVDLPTGTVVVELAYDPTDPNVADATCTFTNEEIVGEPAISLGKSSATTSISAPGAVTYNYAVTNIGNTVITDLVVADDNIDGVVSCDVTTLQVAPDTPFVANCTAVHTVTQDEIDADGSPIGGTGFLTNIAQAEGLFGETPVLSSEVTLNIPINYNPGLQIQKEGTWNDDGDGFAQAGETISYTFTVSNIGNVTLNNIGVTDNIVSPIDCEGITSVPQIGSIAVGGDPVECTGTYVITAGDILAGQRPNQAEADSDEAGPVTSNDLVELPQSGTIIIEKETTPAGGTGFGFTDDIEAPNSFTLDDGQSKSFTVAPGTYLVAEDDKPGWTLDEATCGDGSPVNAIDLAVSETVTCTFRNSLNTASFTVNKDFTDGSDASVDVTLTCSSGTVTAPATKSASEAAPAIFEVTGFEPGATCTATEAATPGYDQDISACDTVGLEDPGSCTIVNTLRVTDFTVEKDFSDGATDSVVMTLTCSSGAVTTNDLPASEASPAIFEVTGYDLDATCTATEAATPGYTQDISDCQDDDPLVGEVPRSCTMVNTLNRGTFTVNKTYDDGNDAPVTVTASCTGGGSFEQNPLVAAPGAPAVFDYIRFDGDPTCTAVESGVSELYEPDNSDCQDNDPLNSSCTIANKLIREARFKVTKDFTDDNPAEVQVTITCNDGFISDEFYWIAEGDMKTFVVNEYGLSSMDCWVTETDGPDGYDLSYEAGATTGIAGRISDDEPEPGCYFEDILAGEFYCNLTNEPADVTVTVKKVWNVAGEFGDVVLLTADIKASSCGEISGGTPCNVNGCLYATNDVPSGYCKTLTFDGPEAGEQSFTVPSSYDGVVVYLEEMSVESTVATENDCNGSVEATPGSAPTCTFTNTVFFEGIPTLNQWGLAIMALLMLGIGFVGLRRFV